MEISAHRPVVAQGIPGNAADVGDMKRMRRPQELNRLYSAITLVGYAAIVGLTWPFALFTGSITLTNGGPAGAIWVFVGVAIGMFSVVLSMAEMASIEPTAGGQYHWVSIFAPKRFRKILSYLVGWLCALGWQSFVPGSGNVCATVIQGWIVVVRSSYVPKPYQLVLFTIFISAFAIIFNIFWARKLPGIEGFVFTVYMIMFVVVFVVLLVLGPRSSGKEIFTDFQDNAGWGSIGTACFVGISGPVITLIGADSSVHLAEELKDASRQLPRAMLLTAGVNYTLGFVMTIAFIAVVGNVAQVTATPTGVPFVQVIWNATLSRAATIIIVLFIWILFFFSAMNQNTTSSRQLYAFARDGGLPYSGWVSYVSPSRNIPVNAVMISFFIASGLALIPLGSSIAFLNITSIGNSGLIVSYIICIFCRLYHRNAIGPYAPLSKPPPFFLGTILGNAINGTAILFLTVFVVAIMFPQAPNPTVESMNWSCLGFSVAVIISLVCYFSKLRHTYLGAGGGQALELVQVDMEHGSKAFDKQT